MNLIRRVRIESPLSAEELRARLEAAIGRPADLAALFDSSWSGNDDTPYIGKLEGNSFEVRRRAGGGYCMIRGTIEGNVLDVQIGPGDWGRNQFIYTMAFLNGDADATEAELRNLVNAPR